MNPVRSPAVAGRFYPRDPHALRDEIKYWVEEDVQKISAFGVMAPHAGYRFSGPVAGAVYSRVEIPDTVILIGPNHTGQGKPVSIQCEGAWDLPLGRVEIDSELAHEILEQSRVIKNDPSAHRNEHSLETQIPFLQFFREQFKIVPILMMRVDFSVCEDVGRAIAGALKKVGRPALVVASTDMTHYESHEDASRTDLEALDVLTTGDPHRLFDHVRSRNITMCGVNPVTAMLVAGQAFGAHECEIIRYMTSGEVNGDRNRVVGYAGAIYR